MVTIPPERRNKYIKKSIKDFEKQESKDESIRPFGAETQRRSFRPRQEVQAVPQRLGRGLNPEWIKEQFKNEGCELISKYENCNSEMTYKYDGKMYITTWKRFQKGNFEHKRLKLSANEIKVIDEPKEDGISIYCYKKAKGKTRMVNRKVLNPDYIKHQFLKEDCEVLNAEDYENTKTKLKYKYIGNDERCKD